VWTARGVEWRAVGEGVLGDGVMLVAADRRRLSPADVLRSNPTLHLLTRRTWGGA
jgi:hypothetical protein